jgi:hypothetical protein
MYKNKTRVRFGATSLSNSSHFPPSEPNALANPGDVTLGVRRIPHRPTFDGVASRDEYDRNRLRLLLHGAECRQIRWDNHVRRELHQISRDNPCLSVVRGRAEINPQVAAFYPAQLRQLVPEYGETGGLCIMASQYRDPPDARTLLRERNAQHRRTSTRRTNRCNEFASSHPQSSRFKIGA